MSRYINKVYYLYNNTILEFYLYANIFTSKATNQGKSGNEIKNNLFLICANFKIIF